MDGPGAPGSTPHLFLGGGERLRWEVTEAGARLVREKAEGGGGRELRSFPRTQQSRLWWQPPSMSISPDRSWLLWMESTAHHHRPTAREVSVRATPVDGGREQVWKIKVPTDCGLLNQLIWMPDSRTWLAWQIRYRARAPQPGATGSGQEAPSPVDYTLLEGRFGRADVRPVLTLPDMGMYPRILGSTADGLTLAAESDRALVTFPGADAERVRTRFTVEQPPHASTASLALSPDGKRLAWFVQRLPVFEPTSPLLRLLEPRTPNRKTREGASVAYTAELTTSGAGPFRMVGGVDYATSGGEVDFWWAPDSRGIYFSHYSPSGRRYYRVSLP